MYIPNFGVNLICLNTRESATDFQKSKLLLLKREPTTRFPPGRTVIWWEKCRSRVSPRVPDVGTLPPNWRCGVARRRRLSECGNSAAAASLEQLSRPLNAPACRTHSRPGPNRTIHLPTVQTYNTFHSQHRGIPEQLRDPINKLRISNQTTNSFLDFVCQNKGFSCHKM